MFYVTYQILETTRNVEVFYETNFSFSFRYWVFGSNNTLIFKKLRDSNFLRKIRFQNMFAIVLIEMDAVTVAKKLMLKESVSALKKWN